MSAVAPGLVRKSGQKAHFTKIDDESWTMGMRRLEIKYAAIEMDEPRSIVLEDWKDSIRLLIWE